MFYEYLIDSMLHIDPFYIYKNSMYKCCKTLKYSDLSLRFLVILCKILLP